MTWVPIPYVLRPWVFREQAFQVSFESLRSVPDQFIQPCEGIISESYVVSLCWWIRYPWSYPYPIMGYIRDMSWLWWGVPFLTIRRSPLCVRSSGGRRSIVAIKYVTTRWWLWCWWYWRSTITRLFWWWLPEWTSWSRIYADWICYPWAETEIIIPLFMYSWQRNLVYLRTTNDIYRDLFS